MIKVKKIEHVAVAVSDLDAALARFEGVLGVKGIGRELVASQKTELAMLSLGDAAIELISPKGNEGLQRFLDKRGPGIHHIAVEVEGIESALKTLKELGIPLVDEVPRAGARGRKIAFVHPKATGGVLIELVEASSPAPSQRAL